MGTDSTTGLPAVKVTGTNEEFYDITDAINYSTLISTNGNIYNYASDKSILLAKYNLNKMTGIQTSSTTNSDYVVEFSSYQYWSDFDKNIYNINYKEPSGTYYSIAYYVENYIVNLRIEGTGRLLTYTEANAMASNQKNNGQYYWLGSASDEERVRYAYDNSTWIATYDNSFTCGVRPVIVVSTSDIGA